MPYLLRWLRHNQSLATRSATLMTTGNVYETTAALSIMKPLYKIIRTQPIMTSSLPLLSPPPPPHHHHKSPPDNHGPKMDNNKQPPPPPQQQPPSSDKKDDINYVIKFKQGLDVKKVFKEFYSLYGPLFVVCHVSIGLISLGFFCSLTWFAIDLTKIVPDFVVARIGESMTTMTGTGGKFVVAYAIHKLLLPVRLGAAIYITRSLSRIIKRRKNT